MRNNRAEGRNDTPPTESRNLRTRFRYLWRGYRDLWDSLTGWRLLGFLCLHESVLFLLACTLVFLPAFQSGRSLIWQGDSLSQHFPRFLYISETFREAFRSLLSGNGWNFPLYDFRVGLTMQDTQMGFPQILAVLCPAEHMAGFYGFCILLNYYMAGLAFTVFGWYFRQRPLPILIGAVSYPFCGYALAAGVWHPYFMQPLVYLPLLLTGAEQVLRKKPAWLLIVSVVLSLTAQNGLYFSCMQAIFVTLYVFIRFFDLYGRDGEPLWENAPMEENPSARTPPHRGKALPLRGKPSGGKLPSSRNHGTPPRPGFPSIPGRVRAFVELLGRLAVWGGCGILLAGFVALPALMSIVDIGRVGRDVLSYQSLLHYEADYYRRFFAGFVGTPGELTDWTCLGFTGLSVPCAALLFRERRRETRGLRLCFLLLTGMLWIPAAGYVLSGFSNVSNRFCYAYAFCVCAMVMFMIPRLSLLGRRGAVLLASGVALYTALLSGLQLWQGREEPLPGIPLVLFTLGAMLLSLELCRSPAGEARSDDTRTGGRDDTGMRVNDGSGPERTGGTRADGTGGLRTEAPVSGGRGILYAVCLLCALLSVWVSGWLWYAPGQRNSVGSLVSDPWEQIQEGQYHSLAQNREIASDTDFFRVAGDSVNVVESNLSWYYGFNGVSMFPYYGYSAAWLDWVSELELSRTNTGRGTLFNLDTRAPMLSLASVKYFALRERYKAVTPFGFRLLEEVENGGEYDALLKNENWLPLGYTYDRWMSHALYDTLDTPVKEEAQLSAVVLEETPALSGLQEVRMVDTDEVSYAADRETAAQAGTLDASERMESGLRKLPWQIARTDRVEWRDGVLTVGESGASMSLTFSGLPNRETYLRVEELDLTDGNSTSRWQLRAESAYGNADSLFIADAFVYSYGQHSQIFDLGFSGTPVTEITLTFPVAGRFRLGNLEIWQQTMDYLPEQSAARREEALENVTLHPNGVTGTIYVSRDKILCLSIPRLRGWRAYLDGERVKLYAANTAFLGLEVPKGNHTVELRYTPAGWPLGFWMSAAGIALLAALLVRQRKKCARE